MGEIRPREPQPGQSQGRARVSDLPRSQWALSAVLSDARSSSKHQMRASGHKTFSRQLAAGESGARGFVRGAYEWCTVRSDRCSGVQRGAGASPLPGWGHPGWCKPYVISRAKTGRITPGDTFGFFFFTKFNFLQVIQNKNTRAQLKCT